MAKSASKYLKVMNRLSRIEIAICHKDKWIWKLDPRGLATAKSGSMNLRDMKPDSVIWEG